MSDALRVLVVIGVLGVSVLAGVVATRFARPIHPQLDLSGLRLSSGVVIFTSTGCASCGQARAVAEAVGVPIREVTYELEPGMFEDAGVEAVPLTVVVAAGGGIEAQFAGVPRRRALARAVVRSGIR